MADPEILCDSEETADRVVRDLLSVIVSRCQDDELRWTILVLGRCPDIKKKCVNDTWSAFLERVRGKLDVAEDGAPGDAIQALADLLHVQPTPKPAPAPEPSVGAEEPPAAEQAGEGDRKE